MTTRPVIRRVHGDASGTQNFAALDEITRTLAGNPLMRGRYIEVECRQGDVIRVNHGLGRTYQGFICTSHSGLMIDRSVGDKDKVIVLRVQTPWNLIEEQTTTATGTTVSFKNLDGDIDEAYYFEIASKRITGTADIYLYPNGTTSTFEHAYVNVDNTTVTGAESTTPIVASMVTDSEISWSSGTFYAKSGSVRHCNWHTCFHDGTDTRYRAGAWRWTDTSANVTSVDFTASTADYLRTGSTFRLFRRGLGAQTVGLWIF